MMVLARFFFYISLHFYCSFFFALIWDVIYFHCKTTSLCIGVGKEWGARIRNETATDLPL